MKSSSQSLLLLILSSVDCIELCCDVVGEFYGRRWCVGQADWSALLVTAGQG